MVEKGQIVPISDGLFYSEKVQKRLETRGFSRIKYSLAEENSDQLEHLVSGQGLQLVLGQIWARSSEGTPELQKAAYIYDPLRIESRLLPSNSEDLREILPEVLRLQNEGWPLIFTEKGAEILRLKAKLQKSA